MLNNLVSIIKGLFSNSFWFGSFLPVSIVACIHYLLWLWHRDSATPNVLASFLRSGTGDTWSLVLLVGGLVVIAYVLTPLIPVFRALYEGTLLPEGIYAMFRRNHCAHVDAVRAEVMEAASAWKEWDKATAQFEERLRKARDIGHAKGSAADELTIAAAEQTIGALGRWMESDGLPSMADAGKGIDSVEAALKSNSANLPPSHAEFARSARLNVAHKAMLRIILDSKREALHRWQVRDEKSALLCLDAPQATRVGDARVLAQNYSAQAYGVDFEFLWPRLQLVLPDGPNRTVDRIMAAQAQQDFAVLTLTLLATVPLVWLPTLALSGESPLAFLVLGLASPVVLQIFYELVVWTQHAYGDVIKGVVDRYRLEVLTKTLRQPLPASRAAERELWTRVSKIAELGEKIDFPYRHT